MKPAHVRMVPTALQKMVESTDGMRVVDALARAERNLKPMRDDCRQSIAEGLHNLAVMAAGPLNGAIAADVHRMGNELLGYCAAAELPPLAGVLLRLCRMADALYDADQLPRGAFSPALNLALLVYEGKLSAADQTVLLEGLDRCVTHYRSLPRRSESPAPA